MLETQKGAADRSGFGPEANHPQSTSRRRVILGGAALVPTVVTLASRPALAGGRHAWAGRCTISGWASLNPSVMDDRTVCKGRSHGYWKTHGDDWPRSFHPGPRNPTASGQRSFDILTERELKDLGWSRWKIRAYLWEVDGATLYHDAIGVLTSTYYAGGKNGEMTLMQALHAGNEQQREFANAVLNAAKWGPEYGYTLEEMRDLIALRSSDPTFLADLGTLYDRG